jgi:hypothetical protein
MLLTVPRLVNLLLRSAFFRIETTGFDEFTIGAPEYRIDCMPAKLTVLLVLSLCLSISHVSAQRSPAAPSLDGYRNGEVYANDFFDFRLKFPDGWVGAPEQFKQAVLKSLNASAPNADNRILMMLLRPIPGEPMPDFIAVFSAKHTGTDGADAALDYFKTNLARDTDTEIISPIRIVQFGGRTLAREDSRLKGQPHFMSAFALVKAGHLLSIQAHASTRDRVNAVVEVLSGSVHFK